jgi:hypothetical protein
VIPNPYIAPEIAHQRHRDMLADAARQTLATQAKTMRATPCQPRPIGRRLRQALAAAARLAAARQA